MKSCQEGQYCELLQITTFFQRHHPHSLSRRSTQRSRNTFIRMAALSTLERTHCLSHPVTFQHLFCAEIEKISIFQPVFIFAYQKLLIPLPQNILQFMVVSISFVPYLYIYSVNSCVLI